MHLPRYHSTMAWAVQSPQYTFYTHHGLQVMSDSAYYYYLMSSYPSTLQPANVDHNPSPHCYFQVT